MSLGLKLGCHSTADGFLGAPLERRGPPPATGGSRHGSGRGRGRRGAVAGLHQVRARPPVRERGVGEPDRPGTRAPPRSRLGAPVRGRDDDRAGSAGRRRDRPRTSTVVPGRRCHRRRRRSDGHDPGTRALGDHPSAHRRRARPHLRELLPEWSRDHLHGARPRGAGHDSRRWRRIGTLLVAVWVVLQAVGVLASG